MDSLRRDDPEPMTISCYGVYLPELDEETWLRFVDGRPVVFHNDAIP